MNLSYTSHRHTLITTRCPPVEGEGGVQLACCFTVATADKVGVLVHVGTVGITEDTPADGVEVGGIRDVKVTIHTIHELAVVHPAVLGTSAGDEVVTTHVDSTGSLERYVADDDILTTAQGDTSRLTVVLTIVTCHLNDNLAGIILRLFRDRLSVGKRSTTTAGTHLRNAGIVKSLLNLVRHIPFGADNGIIDADNRLIGGSDSNVA